MYTHEFNIIEAPMHYAKRSLYMMAEGAAFHAIAFNRKTSSGQRTVDHTATLKLLNTTPQTPKGEADIDNIGSKMDCQKAEIKPRWHKDNLQAAGLPAEYSHDSRLGKQHPKVALLRNCLPDNIWTPVRAYHAGQQDTDTCRFCNTSKGTAIHIY